MDCPDKNIMDMCRICLSNHADKDIFQLQANQNIKNKYVEMIMFCLDIQVVEEPKMSTKLCAKCCRKIVAFHKFKTLALKNDAYFKSFDVVDIVKNEVFISNDIKSERLSISDNSDAGDVKAESIVKVEDDQTFSSEDEFLDVIKKIKYEYVEDVAEENAAGRGKRKTNLNSTSKKPIQNEKQMCEECGVTVKDLKSHMYSHMPVAQRKRYKCKHCDKTFSSHSARYKHNKFKHLGIKQECTLCNKIVTHIKQHYRTVHNPESLPFACVLCSRRFISKTTLDTHMTSHTKDRPFPCDVCDNKYASRTLLLMHKRRVHDKEKPHLCQLCSKSFFKTYHLQIHLRSHSKEKPYECSVCGKFFSTTTTLRSHRLIHDDARTFECQLCDMTFVKRGYLQAHMISHTKEKRHACQYCGVRFGRSDHRKRHEWTAHKKHLATTT